MYIYMITFKNNVIFGANPWFCFLTYLLKYQKHKLPSKFVLVHKWDKNIQNECKKQTDLNLIFTTFAKKQFVNRNNNRTRYH